MAKMMNAMIPMVLRESFQNQWRTCLTMGNTDESGLAWSIERRHLDHLIGERLTNVVDTEDPIHVMTSRILENQAFIAPVARLVKHNTKKVLHELKKLCYDEKICGTGSGNNGKHLVAVLPQQKSTSAMRLSPNWSSDDEAEDFKPCRKCKTKK